MKNLIVYSHPNDKSFCAAIRDTVMAASCEKGFAVKLRDLYKNKFDPIQSTDDFVALSRGKSAADVAVEQSQIAEADIITFIYPIWWAGLPAMIKGYMDRVFSYGFAYKIGPKGVEGLLTGKKVLVFNTMGTPYPVYEQSGMIEALKKTSDTGIFVFSGMTVARHCFFGGVPSVDDATRKGYLEEARSIVRGI